MQLNSVCPVHIEQKLDISKIKIYSLLLSLHRVTCIFIRSSLYFLRFCGFCHLSLEACAQSRAGCRQAPSLGSLRRLLGKGAGLGPSHGLWCCRVCVGAALGVLWQGRLWPLAACRSWLYRAGEGSCQPAPPGAREECAGHSLQQCFSITILTPFC